MGSELWWDDVTYLISFWSYNFAHYDQIELHSLLKLAKICSCHEKMEKYLIEHFYLFKQADKLICASFYGHDNGKKSKKTLKIIIVTALVWTTNIKVVIVTCRNIILWKIWKI